MLLLVLFGMQHPSVTSAIRWGASASGALRKCSDFIPMSSKKIRNIEEDIHHYELWFNKQFQPTTTKQSQKHQIFLSNYCCCTICMFFSQFETKKNYPPKRRSFMNLQLLSRPPTVNGETYIWFGTPPSGLTSPESTTWAQNEDQKRLAQLLEYTVYMIYNI